MDEYIYDQNLISSFFIENCSDSICIITNGPDSPFNFIDILEQTIEKYAKNIDSKNINIFIDMLSCVGSGYDRFCRLKYNKVSKEIDFFDLEYVEYSELNKKIKDLFDKFYKSNLDRILENSVLSETEKQQFKNAA